MISGGLKHGFDHRTPWVDGLQSTIQTGPTTPSFIFGRSIETEHELTKESASRRRPLVTFLLRPFGYKFAGQSATAISNGMTFRAGQRIEPVGK